MEKSKTILRWPRYWLRPICDLAIFGQISIDNTQILIEVQLHGNVAIGVDDAVAQGSILLSLGIDNSEEQIEYVLETLPPIIKRLREMSPLYEDSQA